MSRYVPVLLTLVLAFGLAACGGGGGTTGDADVSVAAVAGFDFQPTELTAEAGEITVELVNEDEQRHTFVIDEADLRIDAQGGQSATGTATLEAGTYRFYCDVPGHEEAGMVGELEVQ